jgi:hypothetical protein
MIFKHNPPKNWMKKPFSNINSFVYFVTQKSEGWKLSSSYNCALRWLLDEKKQFVLPPNLSINQEYNFIAKIIFNEKNKSKKEVDKNCKIIIGKIDEFFKTKKQEYGESLLIILFHIAILNSLEKRLHFLTLNKHKNKIGKFLEEYNHLNDEKYQNYSSFLKIEYNNQYTQRLNINNRSLVGLASSLLYDLKYIKNPSKRDKTILMDIYLKQMQIEEKGSINPSNESSQGEFLETAIILKAGLGEGLYLPEIERDQYFSNFSKEIVEEKFKKIIREGNHFELFSLSLPDWSWLIAILFMELFLLILPQSTSINIYLITISGEFLSNNPLLLLVANSIIFLIYLIISKRKINKRIKLI